MALTKVLVIENCLGDNGEFLAKGTIHEYDDEKKSDVPVLAALKAGARIVPVVKENLLRCKSELERKRLKVPDDVTEALAEIAKAEKK
jgi:hypothetical protein